ncbi:1,4-Dihydroxy-2-naphthoyl-CoA synthase [Brevundimonas diminuta]|jgi:methylglutaconyl-CoA hydratase|uniref:Enoyl-CoA hydratase n=2 Tax=Brevundimonas TaxID=41275 RepID=A0A1Z3M068_BREDI|nr:MULTISPECIES: enoyl-CoA hydratase-related protein [Brevundimonas]ASD27843.1 enoyl-CoA hydratase [Brevundimonas diminuta]MBD3820539.1 enoyl-CoA hydratase/isomerase family protein [Brevundimonas diminuta]OMG54219.1 enoyl-CoA hydratase [Brevundimonas sp. ZS04]RSB40697.1 enoyl-CoA hydratase/isomerase family protein [Brevundimonas sp. 357]SPU43396.1 1,4-Dihydroxy-2-naphthoyl-CoA synthase [Brevundimonas diminuta]
MTDQKPTEEELNALDITDAEAAEMNAIAHPFVADAAPDANDDLVQIDATADGVVFVTINRPEKKNAFDAATIAALYEAFETLHGADKVRVVFIRGAGGTFSAGADLNWMRSAADWSESDNRDDAMGLAKMLKALHDVPALTVALVEGAAMGGGAGIVAACDMAVAVEGTRFAFSEVKLGLIPATIAPYVIEAVGARRARQLFLTANIFDADYAAHAGLIDMVLPEGSVDEFISMLTDSLSANAPGAMGDAKRLVNDVAGEEIDNRLLEETAKRIARARVSAEGQEGVRAFLDKRAPNWAQ